MRALLVASIFFMASPASAAVREVCNTSGAGLNFRSGPSIHARRQGGFVEGHDVTVLGRSANGAWLRVRDNGGSGRIGWVFAAYTCPRETPAQKRTRQLAEKGGGGSPTGCRLQDQIMNRAKSIGNEINRTGGYRFDGRNDCYGFVRRVWDPVLREMGKSPLPTSDIGSGRWAPINWNALRPGDVLSTHQGHAWGANWHGGLYAGKINGVHYIYDNSGSRSARLRPLPYSTYFRYAFRPTHEALECSPSASRSGGGKALSR